MSINLQKGQNAPVGSVQQFTVGMGWDANATQTGVDFDLDASAFMLGANGKVLSNEHFIFYNNLSSPEGCVVHTGDNLTGEGEGDDESLKVDMSKLPQGCESIVFVVTIHDAASRGQNFGQVSNAFIRIFDTKTNEEIMKFDLGEDFSIETAVEFGTLYQKEGTWKFRAVGAGYSDGLERFVNQYT